MTPQCSRCLGSGKPIWPPTGVCVHCLGTGVEPEPAKQAKPNDPVNNPSHYTSHPSGVECITVTEHMSFCVGNAIKYLWRADLKNDAVEDLKKARWYIDREISRREKNK